MKTLFVFSSVGSQHEASYKHKAYQSWELNKYDNACVRYNDTDHFEYSIYFNNVLYNPSYKFLNFIWYNTHISILDNYEFIALLDDDLYFNQEHILDNMITYMNQYNIDILSLSNNTLGKPSWYNIMNTPTPRNEIWITNFCEMGAVVLKSNLCQMIIDTYAQEQITIIDFGFNLLFSKIANGNNKTIGITKNLTYYNPPLLKPRYTGRNLFEQNKHKIINPLKPHEGKVKSVIHL